MLARNRVLIYESDHKIIGFRIFGQVINRVRNITDFGKGFGKQAAHTLLIYFSLLIPPLEGGGGEVTALQSNELL